MSLERFVAVDRYLTELLAPPDPVLEATLEANAAAGLPPHDVSPNQGKLLHVLARITRSAPDPRDRHARRLQHDLARARAAADGRLVTLEADPTHADVARANLDARRPRPAASRSASAAALETLPRIAAEESGPFDLVFIDADKASNAAVSRLGARAVAPRAA